MFPEIYKRLAVMRMQAALKDAASYRAALRSAVRGLWTGILDIFEFFEAFESAINRGFRQAWAEGMAEAGLAPEDMNLDERTMLEGLILAELSYIFPFGDDIVIGSKANGGPLQPHMDRVELWVKRYLGVKNQALQMARTDPVLEWTIHAQESCTSCLKLNGQRRRASTWKRIDLRPQHPTKLECMRSAGGVDVCQCELHITAASPTRGRFPKV